MPSGRARWALAAGVLLAVLGAAQEEGADNPHRYMDQEAQCAACHRMEQQNQNLAASPHDFKASVTEICRGCHSPEQTGRSHSVGKDPRRALKRRESPEELPLQWSDDERTEVMTCGTCHNPHLPRFSQQKLFSRQRPHPGVPDGYLTYFLRIRGQTPREGFTPLCHACHPGL